MIEALFLIALYLFGFGIFLVLSLAMGWGLWPGNGKEDTPEFCWNSVLRYALGLAMLSFLAIGLGLAGWIRLGILAPLAVALAIGGVWRGYRRGSLRISSFHLWARDRWARSRRGEKIAVVLTSVWGMILILNILVGGMAPDMGQDALWYHLTAPGQWAITGKAETFPRVMPSNYPLAMEAVYAAVLLIGDEVMCSLLYAQVTLVLLAGMTASAVRFAGGRAGLPVAAGAATFMACLYGIAPLPVLNDAAAALWLMAGFGLLLETIHWQKAADSLPDLSPGISLHGQNSHETGGSADSPQSPAAICEQTFRAEKKRLFMGAGFLAKAPGFPWTVFLAGAMLGTAMAAKLTALGFCVPLIVLYLGYCFYDRAGRVFAGQRTAWLLAGVLLAYLPWAIRGWSASGNPIFPLASSVFCIGPDYQPALEASRRLNNLYPLTPAGFLEALLVGLPKKFRLAMTGLHVLFGLVLIAAVGAGFEKRMFWRWQGLVLLAFYAAFFWMKGANEVPRYFSICYPLAAPALGLCLRRVEENLRPHLRGGLVLVLLASGIFTFGKRQIQVAEFSTIQWKFHPIVTSSQRERYAQHAEKGSLATGFLALRPLLEKDAYVFAPDCNFPYYLKRRCLWPDEVCGDMLESLRSGNPSFDLWGYLRERGFSHVLLTSPRQNVLFDTLASQGKLERLAIPPFLENNWRLYRVTGKANWGNVSK